MYTTNNNQMYCFERERENPLRTEDLFQKSTEQFINYKYYIWILLRYMCIHIDNITVFLLCRYINNVKYITQYGRKKTKKTNPQVQKKEKTELKITMSN